MSAGRRDRLTEVNFHCRACGSRFAADPGRVEDAPDVEHHPWRYFAPCATCGSEAEQSAWERALLKAWSRATGPRTPEGKAASAANLEGHPTPEEAQRTRFNGLKHGLTARVATYFPAAPGRYPHCAGCSYFADCSPADVACRVRTELFMRHHVAFESGDPKLLMDVRADTQAALQALINDMILAIVADGGPRIREVQWYHDEAGVHVARYLDEGTSQWVNITEIKAHPLLKHLMDFIQKNSLTLADMGMTPRVQEDQDLILGHIQGTDRDRQQLLDYQRQQADTLGKLQAMIERSQRATKRDPVLLEHQEQDGG